MGATIGGGLWASVAGGVAGVSKLIKDYQWIFINNFKNKY
jgi:hypothetical protein